MEEQGNYVILKHPAFSKWLAKQKNKELLDAIKSRLRRVSIGNFGDTKIVREGVHELRFHLLGGVRIYFSIHANNTIVVLLAGGKKDTQDADIDKAIKNKEEADCGLDTMGSA